MFAWLYLNEDGEELGSSERFADPEAAESWMGETWSDLRERGVQEVVLVDEERGQRLYRMGLSEASV